MMIFNSLKTRLIISITGIVTTSLLVTTFFFIQKAKYELSTVIEGNALNLLEATRSHVESQYNSILYHETVMLSRRKIELKNNTIIAFSIINNEYQKYKRGQLTEDTAKRFAIAQLKHLRYDEGVGYFWINNTVRPYPRMIMHPTISSLDGQILDNPTFNCALGKKENLFKAFVDVCLKNGEGYVDYLWPKPIAGGLTKEQPKISFVKLFKPWNWVIGTGVYIDDIKKDVQARINAVIKDLNKTILKQRIGKTGYFFIFNEKNYTLVHPNLLGIDMSEVINPETGNILFEEFKKVAVSTDHSMEYLWDKPGFEGEYRFPKKVYLARYEPLGWYIGSSVYLEDYEQKISNLINTIIIFSFSFILLALIISLFVSRGIINPLNILVDSIKKTDKDGVPINPIPETGTIEIKTLGSTMNGMISSILESRKALFHSEEQLAQSRKMDAIGQLAGGVAHDFNNILAGIIGAAEMLNHPKRKLDEKGIKYVKMILKSSRRAADLTAKLLAFGHKGKIVSSPVDMHNLIDDTYAILKSTIDKKIKIIINKSAKNQIVIGDNSTLQNSLMNLCINASQALPDGGEIHIKTKNIRLKKTYCNASSFEIEPGEYIEIEVRDTGSGIQLEDQKKIFEPFFTTKAHGKGTGLGLAAVYGTVQDHHGVITVYSEVDKGTSFHILLPCSEKSMDLTLKHEEVLTGSGQILLVDDEEILRITGKNILEDMGYNVTLAENGKAAVEIFKEHHYEIDLVIMDMIMPEMNGREAFFKMKQINKNCKIIISSGFTKNESLDELRESGLSGFIRKPYSGFELSQILTEVMKE